MSVPNDWGFIADDLTGAALVGGKLANAGLKVVVATSVDSAAGLARSYDHGSAVVGICTDTRNADPGTARERTEVAVAALKALGRRRVFKFVDSTLRGQVGVELAAVQRALGVRDCLVMPGTPSAGRIVSGGIMLAEGKPAHVSPLLENEVLARLPSSDVERLFSVQGVAAATSVPVKEWCRDEFWAKPRRSARVGSPADRLSFEVLDAPDVTSFREVSRFLETTARGGTLDLICGAVGLAEVWAELLQRQLGSGGSPWDADAASGRDELPVPQTETGLPVLVVNGSASPAALGQVDYLGRRGVSLVRLPEKVDDEAAAAELLAADLAEALRSVGSAVLTVPLPTSGGAGLDADAARRLPGRIAAVVSRLLESGEERVAKFGLVLVGGMTAVAVLDGLGVSSLVPLREVGFVTLCSVEPATGPVGFVVLKGGASGSEAALGSIVDNARTYKTLRDIMQGGL